MTLKPGSPLPALSLPATGGKSISLHSFKGRKLVVYFYPRDNTPGCTQQGQTFSALYKEFQKAGADIVGVSRDGVRTHEAFSARFGFPFPLLADLEQKACRDFGVIKEKSMYGRKYLGIERSTFLFGADGKLKREWRAVKLNGHVEEVLEAVKSL
jgi:thioredoxin-dependent peroxiredoxin